MQSVNAIMPDNGMTAAKVRTAEPSKKITESFGSFMTVSDRTGKQSAVTMRLPLLIQQARMFKMPDKAQLQIRIRHFPHRILPRFKRRLKVS